jgi:hypothetical protein
MQAAVDQPMKQSVECVSLGRQNVVERRGVVGFIKRGKVAGVLGELIPLNDFQDSEGNGAP